MINKILSYIFIALAVSSILLACKKQVNQSNDCFPGETTYRSIINKQATVKKWTDGYFYIIEAGTIDTKLYPCNLQDEFKIDGLPIVVTGDVKERKPIFGFSPCCIENFVISKITK